MMEFKVQTCATCKFYNPTSGDQGECRRYPPDTLLNGLVAEEHERQDVPAAQLVGASGVPRLRDRFFWTLRADLGTSFRVTSPDIWCGEYREGEGHDTSNH